MMMGSMAQVRSSLGKFQDPYFEFGKVGECS
jgi:hypothetical protein